MSYHLGIDLSLFYERSSAVGHTHYNGEQSLGTSLVPRLRTEEVVKLARELIILGDDVIILRAP